MLPGLMRSGEWVFAAPGVALLRLWFYQGVVSCRLLCSISGAEFARAEFAHELTAFAARVLSWLGVCSRRPRLRNVVLGCCRCRVRRSVLLRCWPVAGNILTNRNRNR